MSLLVSFRGEHGGSKDELAVPQGTSGVDVCTRLREHFRVPEDHRMILMDEEGIDVAIDHTLPHGKYRLLTCPAPESRHSIGDLQKYLMGQGRRRTRATTQKSTDTHSKRFKILLEIWTTERAYYDGIKFLNEFYVVPMTAPKDLRSPLIKHRLKGQDVHKLFPKSLNEIINLTDLIWSDIDKRVGAADHEHLDDLCVSDIFIKYEPFLKMYTNYAVQFEQACQTLADMRATNHTGVNTYEAEIMKMHLGDSVRGRPLDSLLILPVQRVLRYKMLLEALEKQTKKENDAHPTAQDLAKATKLVTELAMLVNDKKAEAERRNEVYAKQVELKVDNLLNGHREFLWESNVVKVTKLSRKGKKEVFEGNGIKMYIFNDLFFFGRMMSNGFSVMDRRFEILRTSQFTVADVQIGSVEYVQKIQSNDRKEKKLGRFATLRKSISGTRSNHGGLPVHYIKAIDELEKLKKAQGANRKGDHMTQAYALVLVDSDGLPITFLQDSVFKRKVEGQPYDATSKTEKWAARYLVLNEMTAHLEVYDRHDSSAANKISLDGAMHILEGSRTGYGPDKLPAISILTAGYAGGASAGIIISSGVGDEAAVNQSVLISMMHQTNPNPNDVIIERQKEKTEDHHIIKVVFGDNMKDKAKWTNYYIELPQFDKKNEGMIQLKKVTSYQATLREAS